MRIHSALLGTLIVAVVALPATARAFSLTPMSVEFTPIGKGATRSFLLDNTGGTEKLAIQISMAKREMDINGTESNPEAEDDFIVYPPQIVLGPNEKRTVRVTWAGKATPKHELAYRIIAEQLPVDTKKPSPKQRQAAIRMLLRYMGAVYIRPEGARPQLIIEDVEGVVPAPPSAPKKKKITPPAIKLAKAPSSQTPQALAITFENKGTAHQILKDLKLTVRSGNRKVQLEGDALKGISGQNVLARSKRRFVVPWPTELPRESTDVKVDFEIAD